MLHEHTAVTCQGLAAGLDVGVDALATGRPRDDYRPRGLMSGHALDEGLGHLRLDVVDDGNQIEDACHGRGRRRRTRVA